MLAEGLDVALDGLEARVPRFVFWIVPAAEDLLVERPIHVEYFLPKTNAMTIVFICSFRTWASAPHLSANRGNRRLPGSLRPIVDPVLQASSIGARPSSRATILTTCSKMLIWAFVWSRSWYSVKSADRSIPEIA